MLTAKRWPINLPLAVVVLCWGFNFVALKVLYKEMTAPTVCIVRAVIMYLSFVLLCKIKKESLRPLPGDGMKVAISGFLTLGIYMVLFLEGTRQTAPAEAATVLATIPLFAVLWSAILGIEAVRTNVMFGTVVAMTGVAVVMFGGGMAAKGSLFGDLNILAAAIVWSFAAVQAKPLLARYSPVQLLAMGMPFAFPVILLYGGTSVLHARFDHISLTGWVMFAQVALLSGVVAFAGFYIGIQQVGSAVATRYQFFVPLVAVAFAALVLGQTLLPIQFLGMAMVIAGVFFGASKPNLSSTTSRESILVTSIAE